MLRGSVFAQEWFGDTGVDREASAHPPVALPLLKVIYPHASPSVHGIQHAHTHSRSCMAGCVRS